MNSQLTAKKLFSVLLLLFWGVTIAAMAVPAKRGVWKVLTLADGTEVKAQLAGDEHGHYWCSAEGKAYDWDEKERAYFSIDAETVKAEARLRRQQVNRLRIQRQQARRAFSTEPVFSGKKKGIILLVNFSDKKFQAAHDSTLYQRIANEENFTEGRFVGSIADYFKAQSMGQFELDFDVVGPLTVSHPYGYYGRNVNKQDACPAEMVIEAVRLAKTRVEDWTQYDWDQDGEVDQVYVVYAGNGEADSGDENAIWPHAYSLSAAAYYGDGTGSVAVARGLRVNTYACGSELSAIAGDQIAGIGTMCHEFSHCLGYPDFYDTDYSGGQGMGYWDLMGHGSYNGDGYQPAGYTSYERWLAGWSEPVVLEKSDTLITGMKSLQRGGESYVIYNKRHRNEMFLLENRQFDGWDGELPGAGLLILHLDYDADAWGENTPNDDPGLQRMTWMPADGKYQFAYDGNEKYYTHEGMMTDPFPYKYNHSFNRSTTPAAKFNNRNSDGSFFMSSSVEEITQYADGTISFRFVASLDGDSAAVPTSGKTVFYESFDKCDSNGGNDNLWSGRVANGSFLTDNAGWVAQKAYGGSQCARFGTSTVKGSATTPLFQLDGAAKLYFKAGAWDAETDATTLYLSASGAKLSKSSVKIAKGDFKNVEVKLSGMGSATVTIMSEKGRFFLDEVIVKEDLSSGIREMTSDRSRTDIIYTLDGRCLGDDPARLPRGLYIIGGRKVMKK